MKEIIELNINKWSDISCSYIGRQYCQDFGFSQLDLQSQYNPKKLFCGYWQSDSNSLYGDTKDPE